jgi:sugar O-acyltransferase (sialic acid O-acetyltransferase NeuD family)
MEQNKKDLYIIGAGGFGRELELWLRIDPSVDDFKLVGYIDDNLKALEGFKSEYKVLGTVDGYEFNRSDYAVVSIADPCIKESIYKKLKGKVNFYTFIARSALIADPADIGEGSVICPNSIVSANTRMGRFITVNCATQLGHDSVIGDYSSFMASVMIGGESMIGEKAYFGSQSTLVPGRKICKDVKITAGSVVVGNINKPGVYFGNPAKRLFT